MQGFKSPIRLLPLCDTGSREDERPGARVGTAHPVRTCSEYTTPLARVQLPGRDVPKGTGRGGGVKLFRISRDDVPEPLDLGQGAIFQVAVSLFKVSRIRNNGHRYALRTRRHPQLKKGEPAL